MVKLGNALLILETQPESWRRRRWGMPYHVGFARKPADMNKSFWHSKDSFPKRLKTMLNNLSLGPALLIIGTLFQCITTREGADPRIVHDLHRSIRTNNGIACEE